MKTSTRKLLSLLPSMVIVSHNVLDEKVIGVDLKLPSGEPSGLDPNYPGFLSNLGRLVASGHVFEIAVKLEGTHKKGRVVRTFLACHPGLPVAS